MLGATRIQRAGTSIDLPARKVRSVLAALVLEPGATSSADRLVDLVWGGAAPAAHTAPCTATSRACGECSNLISRPAPDPRCSSPATPDTD